MLEFLLEGLLKPRRQSATLLNSTWTASKRTLQLYSTQSCKSENYHGTRGPEDQSVLFKVRNVNRAAAAKFHTILPKLGTKS